MSTSWRLSTYRPEQTLDESGHTDILASMPVQCAELRVFAQRCASGQDRAGADARSEPLTT